MQGVREAAKQLPVGPDADYISCHRGITSHDRLPLAVDVTVAEQEVAPSDLLSFLARLFF